MILCTEIEDDTLTNFERRYMFLEAEKTNKKSNVRRIDIVVDDNGKRKTRVNDKDSDVDDIDLDEDDDMEGIDDQNAEDDEVPDIEDDTEELPDDGEDIDTMGGEDTGDVDLEPEDDQEDTDTGDVEGDDTGGEDTGDVDLEPEDDAEGDDTGGDEGEQTADDAVDDEDDQQPNEDKDEIIQKQTLFDKFNTLYEAVGNYIDKLDGIVGKTDETNHQYKVITDKFKKLYEFLYDYMVIRFKDAPYVNSMLFYQRSIAAINVILDLLQDVRKKEGNIQ